jgi:hypothetical protein
MVAVIGEIELVACGPSLLVRDCGLSGFECKLPAFDKSKPVAAIAIDQLSQPSPCVDLLTGQGVCPCAITAKKTDR